MKISYAWLKDFVDLKGVTSQRAAELLTTHSFETEVSEKNVLNIELLANRVADAASHIGIARELAAILSRKLKFKQFESLSRFKIQDSLQDRAFGLQARFKVNVQTPYCRRYMAAVLEGVRVAQSPKWMQERLIACGLRPINNLVDATNYAMLETGQPLHVFDKEKIKNQSAKSKINEAEIFIREAEQGEKFESLDKQNYILNKGDVVIADNDGILALGGIKGGKKAEIDNNTNRIALESANFDPIAVRKTSARLALKTDSYWRFEHNLSPFLAELGLTRAIELISEIAGGNATTIIDIYPKPLKEKIITMLHARFQELLGIDLKPYDIIDPLESLGFKVSYTPPITHYSISVPLWRQDVELVEDIAEEVVRVYGLERAPSILPNAVMSVSRANADYEFEKLIKDFSQKSGLCETYTYSFVSEDDRANFGFKNIFALGNPISADYKYLRPSISINLLKNAETALSHQPEAALFEVGAVFSGNRGEERHWAGVIASRESQNVFLSAKGFLEAIFEKLGFDKEDWSFVNEEFVFAEKYRGAKIKINNEIAGYIFQTRQSLIDAYNINWPAAIFEINLALLRQLVSEEREFEPLPRYPAITRDISIVVPNDFLTDEAVRLMQLADLKHIEDIELADYYQNESLGENMKSLTFHIIFRAPDKTLADKDVDAEMRKIISLLEKKNIAIR